jgi:hypothetical protein
VSDGLSHARFGTFLSWPVSSMSYRHDNGLCIRACSRTVSVNRYMPEHAENIARMQRHKPISKLAQRTCAAAIIALVALGVTTSCHSPARSLEPILHARPEDRYPSMRAATDVLLVKILHSALVSGPRDTPKPAELGGPATPTIPLHLARVRAQVLLSLRGGRTGTVGFYSWVWASGKHGGPRLFSAIPGDCHIVLLRRDGPFLRSVGDYAAYDLPIPCGLTDAFMAEWNAANPSEADFWARFVRTYLHTELAQMRSFDRNYWPNEVIDLAGLTSTLQLASLLDAYCVGSGPVHGRFAACVATARQFPGRCEAYRIALQLAAETEGGQRIAQWECECRTRIPSMLRWARTHNWPIRAFGPQWQETPEQQRMRLRVYASAMNPEVRGSVCAQTAERIDIPECRR